MSNFADSRSSADEIRRMMNVDCSPWTICDNKPSRTALILIS